MTYQTIFTNKSLHLTTEIDSISNGLNIMPMVINDVIIGTDGFEVLTIENPELYSEKQLASFEYKILYPYVEKDQKILELINYHLESYIPVNLLERKSNKEIATDLLVSMAHDGTKLIKALSLFDQKIIFNDMEEAMQSLQSLIQNDYCLLTFSNCSKSFWNPYGGIDFINQLCFKKNLHAFHSSEKNKYGILTLMSDDINYDVVPLTYRCSDFDPK